MGAAFGPQPKLLLLFASVFVFMLAIGLTGLLSERVRDLDSER